MERVCIMDMVLYVVITFYFLIAMSCNAKFVRLLDVVNFVIENGNPRAGKSVLWRES